MFLLVIEWPEGRGFRKETVALKNSFETPWPGMGVGGSLALDFANTVDWRLREIPTDSLRDFTDLLRWARTAEILTRAEANRLNTWSEAHSRAARIALAGAVEVREAIAAVFQAVSRGEKVPLAPLVRLETACQAAWKARRLVPAGSGAHWVWQDDMPAIHRPAWACALDAAGILTSDDRATVKECADAHCGWLYLDTSKNRSRRWCNMPGCGNRNKARNFYRRTKEKS